MYSIPFGNHNTCLAELTVLLRYTAVLASYEQYSNSRKIKRKENVTKIAAQSPFNLHINVPHEGVYLTLIDFALKSMLCKFVVLPFQVICVFECVCVCVCL